MHVNLRLFAVVLSIKKRTSYPLENVVALIVLHHVENATACEFRKCHGVYIVYYYPLEGIKEPTILLI